MESLAISSRSFMRFSNPSPRLLMRINMSLAFSPRQSPASTRTASTADIIAATGDLSSCVTR